MPLDHRHRLDDGRPHVPMRRCRETRQVRMQTRVRPDRANSMTADFSAHTGAVEAKALAGRHLNGPAAGLLRSDKTGADSAGTGPKLGTAIAAVSALFFRLLDFEDDRDARRDALFACRGRCFSAPSRGNSHDVVHGAYRIGWRLPGSMRSGPASCRQPSHRSGHGPAHRQPLPRAPWSGTRAASRIE